VDQQRHRYVLPLRHSLTVEAVTLCPIAL
jgi:hypothetical protein